MISSRLAEYITFLALNREEKLKLLGKEEEQTEYTNAEGSFTTTHLSEALLHGAYTAIEEELPNLAEEYQSILVEIRCVIGMMAELSQTIDYLWYLDKSKFPISGPLDDAWSVLARLSGTALMGTNTTPPSSTSLSALKMLKSVGYQVRTSK